MAYLILLAAIACEILATTYMKYAQGFTKPLPSIICVLAYIGCCYLLSKALLKINLAAAYATWCGVGIAATALISWFVFGQKLNLIGVFSIILIVADVVILNSLGVSQK